MCDDSLWSDYDGYLLAQDEDGFRLTGEEYKQALTDETLDALEMLAIMLESIEE